MPTSPIIEPLLATLVIVFELMFTDVPIWDAVSIASICVTSVELI